MSGNEYAAAIRETLDHLLVGGADIELVRTANRDVTALASERDALRNLARDLGRDLRRELITHGFTNHDVDEILRNAFQSHGVAALMGEEGE